MGFNLKLLNNTDQRQWGSR